MKYDFNIEAAKSIGRAKTALQTAQDALVVNDRNVDGMIGRVNDAGRLVEKTRVAVEAYVMQSANARSKMGYLQTTRSKNLLDDVKRDAVQNPATPSLIRATAMLLNPQLEGALRGVVTAQKNFDQQIKTPDFAYDLLKTLRHAEYSLNMAAIYLHRFKRAGLESLPAASQLPRLKK